jgi:GT2 family glycosyltransferase
VLSIDVVVVAYRSRDELRECVEPLCGRAGISVFVVDNDCPEHSTETVADLPLTVVEMGRNAGFGAGCNAGAAKGTGEAILFLNPDARMSPDDVHRLAARLEQHAEIGAAGPWTLETTGETQLSVRRFPALRSAFSEAVFVHHLFPRASWSTELVATGYDQAREVDWLTGSALCVRRSAFEAVGGFDERFFMYSEETDLCSRLRDHGYARWYEPAAVARHHGGASEPRPALVPQKTRSRILYARLHAHGLRYEAFRAAFVLYELMRVPLTAVRARRYLRPRIDSLATAVTWRPAAAPDRREPAAPLR